jgi:hypothetical protein
MSNDHLLHLAAAIVNRTAIAAVREELGAIASKLDFEKDTETLGALFAAHDRMRAGERILNEARAEVLKAVMLCERAAVARD